MNEFSIAFKPVVSLFLLMLLGYILRKWKVLDSHLTQGLIHLLLMVTLPALIFVSMQQEYSSELAVLGYKVLLLSFLSYAVFGILAWFFPFLLGTRKESRGVYRFCLMFSNVGFMGYPVIEAILGQKALFYCAIFNIPFHFLAFTVGIWFLTEHKEEGSSFSWSLFFSPALVATLVGFAAFLSPFRLPSVLLNPLSALGHVTTPLSMLVIGSLLEQLSFKELAVDYRVYLMSLIRLFVVPAILYFILKPFYSGTILAVAVLISAMPAAANAPILSEKYGGNGALASRMVFISTVISLFSIPFWSKFLQ